MQVPFILEWGSECWNIWILYCPFSSQVFICSDHLNTRLNSPVFLMGFERRACMLTQQMPSLVSFINQFSDAIKNLFDIQTHHSNTGQWYFAPHSTHKIWQLSICWQQFNIFLPEMNQQINNRCSSSVWAF